MTPHAINLEPLEFASATERDRFLWRLYSEERFSLPELCAAFRMSRQLVADILRREREVERREVARG